MRCNAPNPLLTRYSVSDSAHDICVLIGSGSSCRWVFDKRLAETSIEEYVSSVVCHESDAKSRYTIPNTRNKRLGKLGPWQKQKHHNYGRCWYPHDHFVLEAMMPRKSLPIYQCDPKARACRSSFRLWESSLNMPKMWTISAFKF